MYLQLRSDSRASNVLDFTYQSGKLLYGALLLLGALLLRGIRPGRGVVVTGVVLLWLSSDTPSASTS